MVSTPVLHNSLTDTCKLPPPPLNQVMVLTIERSCSEEGDGSDGIIITTVSNMYVLYIDIRT